MAAVSMVVPAGALAKNGTASSKGKTLKVLAENTNWAAPGDPPDWHYNYIYVQIATDNFRGFDGTPEGVNVTGKYRVTDLAGGSMGAGPGCITSMTVYGLPSHSTVYCDSSTVNRISIKTGNGDDGVKLEATNAAISVPATVSSQISTGKGHDGVWGGNGLDKINTGADNDGGTENTGTIKPESVVGFGGDDKINLSTSDGVNTDVNPTFAVQSARGGDGNDTIITKGVYFDRIYGDDGADILRAGNGSDELYGGPGDDYIRAGNGENHVYGEDGADSLGSGKGGDELFGGAGADSFSSGGGDDVIEASDDQAEDLRINCGQGDYDLLYFDKSDGDPAAWKNCEDKTQN